MQLLLGVTVTALIAYFGQRISRLQYLGQQEVEKNRAQDEALQAYLAQIGNLLLDKATLLRQSEEGAEDRPSSARQSEDGGDGGLRDSSERPPSMADMADFESTTTTTADNEAYIKEDRQDRQDRQGGRRGDENSTPPSDSANVGGHAFHRDPTAYEETF